MTKTEAKTARAEAKKSVKSKLDKRPSVQEVASRGILKGLPEGVEARASHAGTSSGAATASGAASSAASARNSAAAVRSSAAVAPEKEEKKRRGLFGFGRSHKKSSEDKKGADKKAADNEKEKPAADKPAADKRGAQAGAEADPDMVDFDLVRTLTGAGAGIGKAPAKPLPPAVRRAHQGQRPEDVLRREDERDDLQSHQVHRNEQERQGRLDRWVHAGRM